MNGDTGSTPVADSTNSLLGPLSKLLLDDLQGQLLLLDSPQDLFEQLELARHQAAKSAAGAGGAIDITQFDITQFASSELASRWLDDGQDSPSIEKLTEVLPALEDVDTVFLGDLAAITEVFTQAESGDPGQANTHNTVVITRILSFCRDRVRGRVFIRLRPDSNRHQFPAELLFSLGYIKLPIAVAKQAGDSGRNQIDAAGEQLSDQIFFYSLQSYKTQPDWLNSRFWANPERWNLPN